MADSVTATPDGWRKLSSVEHIEPHQSSPYPARRRRTNRLTYPERCMGSFNLHLCPEHPNAFDAHPPRTDGRPGARGSDAKVSVSCGCGANLSWTSAGTAIGRPGRPANNAENLWWSHLPEELRAYVNREAS
jgi:hypothetical protein